jgi:hypothetical protein
VLSPGHATWPRAAPVVTGHEIPVSRLSGKAVARTEPCQHSTSPPSPLSFRTSGFPQYGCKAGCQMAPAHAQPAARGLPPPLVLSARTPFPRTVSRRRRTSSTAVRAVTRATPGALAPVQVMLSQTLIAYRPHPPHSPTPRDFTALRLIRGAVPRPDAAAAHERFRAFTPVPSRHVALIDPGESTGCMHPVPSPAALAFVRCRKTRHSRVPHNPLPVGLRFRGCPGSHRCDLSACSPPWTDPTRLAPGRRRLLQPGFRRVSHPSRRRL